MIMVVTMAVRGMTVVRVVDTPGTIAVNGMIDGTDEAAPYIVGAAAEPVPPVGPAGIAVVMVNDGPSTTTGYPETTGDEGPSAILDAEVYSKTVGNEEGNAILNAAGYSESMDDEGGNVILDTAGYPESMDDEGGNVILDAAGYPETMDDDGDDVVLDAAGYPDSVAFEGAKFILDGTDEAAADPAGITVVIVVCDSLTTTV